LLAVVSLLLFPYCTLSLYAQPLQTSPAAPLPGFTAEQILTFAEQLLKEGEFFRAITEYRRFIFVYPDDARAAMALFRIGLAYYRGQKYAEALQTFRDVAQQYPESSYGNLAQLWQGESLLRQAQYGPAAEIYADMRQRLGTEAAGQFAHYQRGWTMLYQRRWQEAATELQQISPTSSLYPAAQQLAAAGLDGEHLPQKSPLLAGILSGVLPGSGQLYDGRPGDALLAFLLNGVFIVGTVEAIHHGEFAIAGILSFFEAGWYTGNVYGAVNGAHKYNRHVTETFLQNLENRFRLPPPEARSSSPMGLHVQVGF
jgi:TolA-binding protein